MTAFYIVCLIVGVFSLFATTAFRWRSEESLKAREGGRWPEDLGTPGVRGERSDDYLGEGGVGGVEGEGHVPGVGPITRGGGIGGAEGGDDMPQGGFARKDHSILLPGLLSVILLGSGSAGLYLVANYPELNPPSSLGLSLAGGVVAGVLALGVVRLFQGGRSRSAPKGLEP